MKITKAEVRTTYTVEVTFREWWDVLKVSDRETIEDARKRFEQFPLWLNTDAGKDYTKLAKALGFDGFQNAGYYLPKKHCLVAEFFRYGDNL